MASGCNGFARDKLSYLLTKPAKAAQAGGPTLEVERPASPSTTSSTTASSPERAQTTAQEAETVVDVAARKESAVVVDTPAVAEVGEIARKASSSRKQVTEDCLVPRDQAVLGIRNLQCASCGSCEVVRNRAFVEKSALYCERCWGWYDRCGRWGPSIRVNTNPPRMNACGRAEYGPEDCFILSAFVCAHDDFTLSRELVKSLPDGKEFSDWHGARHLATHLSDDDARLARDPETSTMPDAWSQSVARLEEAFGVRAAAIRLNLYRDSSDFKPMHHDRGQDDEGVPQVTVGVSLGVTRELVFLNKQTGLTMSFPLRNGDVFTFTPELNAIWMHGVSKTDVAPEDDGPRVSFVIWGPRTDAEGEPIAKANKTWRSREKA